MYSVKIAESEWAFAGPCDSCWAKAFAPFRPGRVPKPSAHLGFYLEKDEFYRSCQTLKVSTKFAKFWRRRGARGPARGTNKLYYIQLTAISVVRQNEPSIFVFDYNVKKLIKVFVSLAQVNP